MREFLDLAGKGLLAVVLTMIAVAVQAPVAAQTIVMSYNSDWPPYSSGAGPRVEGILPALMTEILANRMGLTVRNVGYPWKRVQSSVKAGQVDAMVTVPTDPRLAYTHRSRNIVYSLNMVLAVPVGSASFQALRASPTAATLKRFTPCDILGNGWGKRFFASNDIKPVIATKVVSCLRMVAKGRVDASLQAEAVLRRAIPSAGLEREISIIPDPLGAMDFTLLVSKKSQLKSDFLQRFDTLLDNMKSDGSYDTLVAGLRKGGF